MKWSTSTISSIILGCHVVKALPPPFVLQQQGSAGLNTLVEEEPVLPQLSADDFTAIEHVKEDIEHGASSILDRIVEQVKQITENNDSDSTMSEVDADDDLHPPHHPPTVIDFSHLTILEIVNASLGHHEGCAHGRHHESVSPYSLSGHGHDPKFLPLHRLAWVVNRTTEVHKLLEKDGITLLAPDDRALTPPRREHGPGAHRLDDSEISTFAESHAHMGAGDGRLNPLQSPKFWRSLADRSDDYVMAATEDEDDDDKDRERRREIIHKIIAYILSYHTLPTVEYENDLVDRATVATELDSSRIKVQPAWALFPHPYPTVKFNGYAYKRGPTIKAKNGVIHLVGAPLLPPLSPLNGIFMFPTATSTFTSDLQRLGLTEGLLPHMPHEDGEEDEDVHVMAQELLKEHGKDAKTYTLFVPGNFAFNRLPPKVLAFLHSPFPISKRILSYVLKYHIVPDIAFFSDFMPNDTSKAAEYITEEQIDVEVPSEWLNMEDARRLQPREVFHERYSVLARPIETVNGLPIPPRSRCFPRPSFPRGPPRFPGRDRDHEHDPDQEHGPPHHAPPHDHETHRANVTHYRLPTLLSVSGQNPNATMPVAVVKYRFLGKGPIDRSVIVLPHHEHEHDHHDDHKPKHEHVQDGPREREHGHPPPAHPVKVFLQDLPARNGAVQVVETLLRPPMPHHEQDAHKSTRERQLMKRYLH